MSAADPRTPSAQDALELLSDAQDELLELFDRYDELVADDADADQRRELAGQVCSLLAVHVEIKRALLYPAARDALDDASLVDEVVESHAALDETLADLEAADPADPRHDAGVRVLQELFVDAMEQERTRLYPALRASELDLETLGGELAEMEERLLDADDELGTD